MLLGLRHNDATNSLLWLACDYELSAAPPFHVVTERRHVERHVNVFYLTYRPMLICFFLLNHIDCWRKCIRTSTNIYLKYFETNLALHLHSLNCLSLFRISESDRIAWRQRDAMSDEHVASVAWTSSRNFQCHVKWQSSKRAPEHVEQWDFFNKIFMHFSDFCTEILLTYRHERRIFGFIGQFSKRTVFVVIVLFEHRILRHFLKLRIFFAENYFVNSPSHRLFG